MEPLGALLCLGKSLQLTLLRGSDSSFLTGAWDGEQEIFPVSVL